MDSTLNGGEEKVSQICSVQLSSPHKNVLTLPFLGLLGLLKKACFFTSYPDAALFAATQKPPLIRMSGLWRVCHDSVADFHSILPSQWSSESQQRDR
jgi:hypothetical protein